MGTLKTVYRKILPDMALYFGVITLPNLLLKHSVRSALKDGVRRIFTKNVEKPFHRVPVVEHHADRILETLNEKGIIPKIICIDGMPGSGKSTLGRTLAERCNLEWKTLYWKEIKKGFSFKEETIYENMRLVRTQDVENFDVISTASNNGCAGSVLSKIRVKFI